MGLLDDILGPIRDLASVKDEVAQNVTEVKDTLAETKDQIIQPLESPLESGDSADSGDKRQ